MKMLMSVNFICSCNLSFIFIHSVDGKMHIIILYILTLDEKNISQKSASQ